MEIKGSVQEFKELMKSFQLKEVEKKPVNRQNIEVVELNGREILNNGTLMGGTYGSNYNNR